jgi:ribonucleoside-diphosphate reductase alpha chain
MKHENLIDLSVPQSISVDVLLEKYAKEGEATQEEIFARVAKALASIEKDPALWEEAFLYALRGGFIPAGRIMSAAGTGIRSTLMNCFVQPVGDSFLGVDKNCVPGIYPALSQAGETMRRGGGVGYDFSAIRPKGSLVKGTKSDASGPVSFMHVFDKSCATVVSAGGRRGAQMGVLRVDHPDIREFCHAKREAGVLTNFNVSVGVSNAFMEAVQTGGQFKLVHTAEPSEEQKQKGAYFEEGAWVYEVVDAKILYDEITLLTYDFAEPGILFIDRMNEENNLAGLGERLSATNPCAEQPLPEYGCCCLGSINLAVLVLHAFSDNAVVDWDRLRKLVTLAVRMLDNVLELTFWPLEEQRKEAMAKRRIGLGFTGLGDALLMLRLKYDTAEARKVAAEIAEFMRDVAYEASIDLAQEKGAFEIFEAEGYLQSPFIQRLPAPLKNRIRESGTRNSHLLSIAPTGTISLAFADNASNGIEPAFSWWYPRNKRETDGSTKQYKVMDHAFRVWLAQGGSEENLPNYFVTALSISAGSHMAMLEVVQPFIDTSISKTVNVPKDYPFDEFKSLYMDAWKAKLKGLATYRPSDVRGAVLVAPTAEKPQEDKSDFDDTDPDRRVMLDKVPEPALSSLRWIKRPQLAAGNPSWTYMVSRPDGQDFAVMVGHVEGESGDKPQMLEVWINGSEAPRGLGAIAKSLSMDMRSADSRWLQAKLESLQRVAGEDAFDMPCPFDGEVKRMPSSVAAMAYVVHARCVQLGVFGEEGPSPIYDALMSVKEPKTGTGGTMSWSVDVVNPATGDDVCMSLKELQMPDGTRRPYSVWLSGNYPRTLDGLCKSLSFDLRVVDPAWVGAKLRQIASFCEGRGDFFAKVPGSEKSESQPSTVAYLAKLILHRLAMLGVLDNDGQPIKALGYFHQESLAAPVEEVNVMSGYKVCTECSKYTVIRKDGCDFCTSCGHQGSCG